MSSNRTKSVDITNIAWIPPLVEVLFETILTESAKLQV